MKGISALLRPRVTEQPIKKKSKIQDIYVVGFELVTLRAQDGYTII